MTADLAANIQLVISAVLAVGVLWLALDIRRGRGASVPSG